MINKIIFAVLILVFSVAAQADPSSVPLSETGMKIIPLEKMDVPDSFKKELLGKIVEERSKGYREQDNVHVRELMSIKETTRDEITTIKNNNPLDTHIKPTISHIKLGFQFNNPIPSESNEIIGYVPAGGYYKLNSTFNKVAQEGWSGVKIFFKNHNIGFCSFTYYDLNISHGAVTLNQDTLSNVVNKKPSFITTEGSNNSGFMYSISWFAKMKMSNLECANMIFDKRIKEDVIALANTIDSNIV